MSDNCCSPEIPQYKIHLPWLYIWFTVLLAGSLYVLGQHEAASCYERSVQRQYDLMQVETNKMQAMLRGHLAAPPKDTEKE
jgi:hypothetical protein